MTVPIRPRALTIHPLIAEREYARLMRNIAIEYGLLFLSNLNKAGY